MTQINLVELQKEVAQEILDKIKSLDPTAIVAGGAPRDWYFNKVAKDIDVFLYFRSDLAMKGTESAFEELGIKLGWLSSSRESNVYDFNPGIHRVANWKYAGVDIQFVFMNKPTFGIVDSFAFNMCKAWFKNGTCHYDRDFKVGVKHKVLYRTGDVYACKEAYKQRIKDKFEDYKYFDDKQLANSWIVMNSLSKE